MIIIVLIWSAACIKGDTITCTPHPSILTNGLLRNSSSALPFRMSNASATVLSSANSINGIHRQLSNGHSTPHLTANTKEEEKYLHTLSKLKDLKLDDDLVLAIPQILVSGSQSSGKSSVLEALTKIPFPRNEDTCTRFVTEVTLRYAEMESWKFVLQFDEGEKQSKWHRECNDSKKIPALFEEASTVLFPSHKSKSGFSKSVLRIEAFSPVLQPLQIVDIPGLILNDPDDKTNVDKVRGMVLKYVKDRHSTILAVISATQDLKEHEILSISKEYDASGSRTLVVITKPDLATPSKAEYLVKMIRGEASDSLKYNYKWHVVRNRAESESDSSWEKRNSEEDAFFRTASSPWNNVPADKRGAPSLASRLREILFKQDLLGHIGDRIKRYLKDCETDLGLLGGGNPSPEEKSSTYSISAAMLRRKALDHARGYYDNDVNDRNPNDKIFLRSRIHEKNVEFRNQVLVNGHKWESGFFASDPDRYMNDGALPARVNGAGFIAKSEEEEVKWVKSLMLNKGGNFLPLDHNPARESDIFHTISTNWEALAARHLEAVHKVCKDYFVVGTSHAFAQAAAAENYVRNDTNFAISTDVNSNLRERAFGYPNSNEVATRLVRDHIAQRLDIVSKNAEKELSRLERDRRRPINTYNLRFETIRKDYREGNKFSQFGGTLRAAKQSVGEFNAESLARNAKDETTKTAEDFLRAAWIYYG